MVQRSLGLSLAAAAVLAAAPAGASAASLSGTLAEGAAPGAIAAYGQTVAWNRWDAAGYRIVVDRGGKVRTLDVPPARRPFALSAGRGPDGGTWIVWSRCGGREDLPPTGCDLEAFDLGANAPRPLPFAARPGIDEVAPAIDAGRAAWATAGPSGRARMHLAAVDGSGERSIDVLPTSTCALSSYGECFPTKAASALSSALHGDRLAVTSRVSTTGTDFGICGWTTVRLLDLRTQATRTLAENVCGLSGQTLTDVAFDAAGRLWWRLGCGGDPAGCAGGRAGPFRQTTDAPERLMPASGPGSSTFGGRVDGLAVAGRTPVLLVNTGGCPSGAGRGEETCASVTALADPAFAPVTVRRRPATPPPGYVTVKASRRLLVVRPPRTIACSVGDWRPRPGAVLWGGASWPTANGTGRRSGPAVPVTATSGSRTVRGAVPRGVGLTQGQRSVALNLGGPARACGRRWTLTYRPTGGAPVRFTTRVLPR